MAQAVVRSPENADRASPSKDGGSHPTGAPSMLNLFENISDDERPSYRPAAGAAATATPTRHHRSRSPIQRSPTAARARAPSPASDRWQFYAQYDYMPRTPMGPFMPFHGPAYAPHQRPDWHQFALWSQQQHQGQMGHFASPPRPAEAGAPDENSIIEETTDGADDGASHQPRPAHQMSESEPEDEDDVAAFLADPPAAGTEEGDLLAGYITPDIPTDVEGPPVGPKVKQLVAKYWDSPMSRQHTRELYAGLQRPANLPHLRPTKLNPELQKSLRVQQKARDNQLGAIQWGLQFAALPVVSMLEELSQKKALSPQDIVKTCTLTLRLLGRAANQANNMRRDMLRPHLKQIYQQLCQTSGYDFEYLLPKDLPAAMKAANDASKLCRDLLARQGTQAPRTSFPPFQGPPKMTGQWRDFRPMPPRRRHQRPRPTRGRGRNDLRQADPRRGRR